MDMTTYQQLVARITALENGAGEGPVLTALRERQDVLDQKIEELLDTAATAGSVKALREEVEGVSNALKDLRNANAARVPVSKRVR